MYAEVMPLVNGKLKEIAARINSGDNFALEGAHKICGCSRVEAWNKLDENGNVKQVAGIMFGLPIQLIVWCD